MGQLHGDNSSFNLTLSGTGETMSSDSDSESKNSENEVSLHTHMSYQIMCLTWFVIRSMRVMENKVVMENKCYSS